MKNRFIFLFLFVVIPAIAQQGSFNIDAYKQFLQSHQELTTEQLLASHPAGTFASGAAYPATSPLYLDSIMLKYQLTNHESNLLHDHGFMVSERLGYDCFANAYLDAWKKDLPVFVSTDAILHAVHMSYDLILKNTEIFVLIPKLSGILGQLEGQIPVLDTKYGGNPSLKQMLRDFDVYISVPRILMGDQVSPYYTQNDSAVTSLLALIQAEAPASYPLFASAPRDIDFSQFKVRGHYTDTQYPELATYFKVMIWLGRTEIYLIPPQSSGSGFSVQDIQRQVIDAALVTEAASAGTTLSQYAQMDSIIQFFVGQSDNVTLPDFQELLSASSVSSADQFLDIAVVRRFQDSLSTKPYANQKILSQILYNDPMNPDSIRPASAFMLFGQRFIIDSYITGQVVYDKIMYHNERVTRMLPSTLDVLYALGNDGAAQLLQSELDSYHYGSNLAAARYLVDAYDSTFWQSSLFNLWLNCIRTMNPPAARDSLPPFMQTAAWWQEKMNTQLGSWTELRHDNLLYAKQSYSGGNLCSYPFSYVEPIPAFYDAMKTFASVAAERFQSDLFPNGYVTQYIVKYFQFVTNVADTLGTIARKELAGVSLAPAEISFLKKMIFTGNGCVPTYHGWYYLLYYSGDTGFLKPDYIVADIHTAPTDASGNPVGWVVHTGTGLVNLGVVVADDPSGQPIAYVAPTTSYHEFITTNFLRLSDDDWKTTYLASSTRPSFVNLYLADTSGNSRGIGTNLLMSATDVTPPRTKPAAFVLYQNYPNPFNGKTLINFSISPTVKREQTSLTVYTITGQVVRKLLNSLLQTGNYVVGWDSKDEKGREVASGMYLYELRVGNTVQSMKMSLIK